MFKKLLKIILLLLVLVIILVVAAFFIVTSSSFLKATVLPRVASALGAPVTAQAIDFSLFSSKVKISGVTIGSGDDKLISGADISVDYQFWALMGDRIVVDSMELSNAKIVLKQSSGGVWQLPGAGKKPDKSVGGGSKGKPTGGGKVKLPKIRLSDLKIRNMGLEIVPAGDPKNPSNIKLEGLNLTVPLFEPGKPVELSLDSSFQAESGPMLKISKGKIALKANLLLNKELQPQSFSLDGKVDQLSGVINKVKIDNSVLRLTGEAETKANQLVVNRINFTETLNDKTASNISLSGSCDFKPLKIDMKVDVNPLSSQILNFAGEIFKGWNFGDAKLIYSGSTSYEAGSVSSKGKLKIVNLTVSRIDGDKLLYSSPAVNFELDHAAAVNLAAKQAEIKAFQADMAEVSGRKVLGLSLSGPMKLSWRESNISFPGVSPEVKLKVSQFKLPALNSFMPPDGMKFKAGALNVDLTAKLAGSLNRISLQGELSTAGLHFGGIAGYDVYQKLNANMVNLREVEFNPADLIVHKGTKPALRASATGKFDIKKMSGKTHLSVPELNEKVLELLPGNLRKKRMFMELGKRLAGCKSAFTADSVFDVKQKAARINAGHLILVLPRSQKLDVKLREPMSLSWRTGSKWPASPLKLNIAFDVFNLLLVNAFIPEKSPFKFKSGLFTARGDCVLADQFHDISLDLKSRTSDLGFTVSKDKYEGIGLFLNGKTSLKDFNKLNVKELDVTVSAKQKKALAFGGKFNAVFSESSYLFDLTHLMADSRILPVLPKSMQNSIKVASGNINGKMSGGYTGKNGQFSVIGNMKIANLKPQTGKGEQLPEPLHGNVDFDVRQTSMKIAVRKINLTLDYPKAKLANLRVDAAIPLPFRRDRALVNVYSDRIDLLTLQKFKGKAPEKTGESKTAPKKKTESKEPPPVDMKGLDMLVKLDLKNITYGKEITANCVSEIIIMNNTITYDPLKITLNGTPLNLKGRINLGEANGYSYRMETKFENLALPPILKTFVKEEYKFKKGKVESFSSYISGKGITIPNLNKNLSGFVKMKFRDLSLPHQARKHHFLRAIFIPLEALTKITKLLPFNKNWLDNMNKTENLADDIFDGNRNLNFHVGEVDLSAKRDGKVYLDKFDFRGDFIKSMVFTGYLELNNDLDITLKTETNVSNIVVPLVISGPLNNPKPNYERLVYQFSKNNIRNILDPSNLKKIGIGVENTIDNTGKLLNIFKKRVRKIGERNEETPSGDQIKADDDKSKEDETKQDDSGGKRVKKIEKSIKSFIDGL